MTLRMAGTRTYLVVDDAPTIRRTLQGYLEQEGAAAEDIFVASDGKEGLELFRNEEPDIVFLDIAMPGVDGEQAAQAMLTEDPMTKIVVITGKTRADEQAERLISMGAFAFLEKPVRRSDIERVLRDIDTEEGRGGRIK